MSMNEKVVKKLLQIYYTNIISLIKERLVCVR